MNSAQLTLTLSLVLCIVGFFGYTYHILAGNIGRFTRWSELTKLQWAFFLLAVQFVPCLIILFIVR